MTELSQVIARYISLAMLERIVIDQGVVDDGVRTTLFKSPDLSALDVAEQLVAAYGSRTDLLAYALYDQVARYDFGAGQALAPHSGPAGARIHQSRSQLRCALSNYPSGRSRPVLVRRQASSVSDREPSRYDWTSHPRHGVPRRSELRADVPTCPSMAAAADAAPRTVRRWRSTLTSYTALRSSRSAPRGRWREKSPSLRTGAWRAVSQRSLMGWRAYSHRSSQPSSARRSISCCCGLPSQLDASPRGAAVASDADGFTSRPRQSLKA